MLTKILASAALVALSTSGLAAAPHGVWAVLQDAGGTACYVANRAPRFDEARLSGTFATEQEAQVALNRIVACEANNIDPGKDSSETG